MGLTGIPPTGPVPVAGSPTANQPGSIVNIWNLTPTTSIPVGGRLRLTAGTYTPAPTVFPASTTSAFPLGLFRGLNLRVVVSLTTVGAGSWTGTFTGTGTLFIVAGGTKGGPSSPLWRPGPPAAPPFSPTLTGWGGGGGGAGGVSTIPFAITKGISYAYTIGAAGSTTGAYGGNTVWNAGPTTLTGGGAAGYQGYGGGGGGSGGGGSVTINPPGNTYTGSPGGYAVNNFAGAAAGPTSFNYGGGGGGAGGAGSSYQGGPGVTFPYTGSTPYASGGAGVSGTNSFVYGGSGGNGYYSTAILGGLSRTIYEGGTGTQGIIIIGFG
jgi:hypothetical protein